MVLQHDWHYQCILLNVVDDGIKVSYQESNYYPKIEKISHSVSNSDFLHFIIAE